MRYVYGPPPLRPRRLANNAQNNYPLTDVSSLWSGDYCQDDGLPTFEYLVAHLARGWKVHEGSKSAFAREAEIRGVAEARLKTELVGLQLLESLAAMRGLVTECPPVTSGEPRVTYRFTPGEYWNGSYRETKTRAPRSPDIIRIPTHWRESPRTVSADLNVFLGALERHIYRALDAFVKSLLRDARTHSDPIALAHENDTAGLSGHPSNESRTALLDPDGDHAREMLDRLIELASTALTKERSTDRAARLRTSMALLAVRTGESQQLDRASIAWLRRRCRLRPIQSTSESGRAQSGASANETSRRGLAAR